jgi:hypothetical protein
LNVSQADSGIFGFAEEMAGSTPVKPHVNATSIIQVNDSRMVGISQSPEHSRIKLRNEFSHLWNTQAV